MTDDEQGPTSSVRLAGVDAVDYIANLTRELGARAIRRGQRFSQLAQLLKMANAEAEQLKRATIRSPE